MAVGAAGGLLLALQLDDVGSYASVAPGVAVVALGMGLVFPPMFLAAAAGVPAEQQGAASGLASTALQIGSAAGLAVLVGVATGLTSTDCTARRCASRRPTGWRGPSSCSASGPPSAPRPRSRRRAAADEEPGAGVSVAPEAARGGEGVGRVGRMSPRTVVAGIALGRLALGAALVVAPRKVVGPGWIGAEAERPAAGTLLRAVGARDLAIAIGTLGRCAAAPA